MTAGRDPKEVEYMMKLKENNFKFAVSGRNGNKIGSRWQRAIDPVKGEPGLREGYEAISVYDVEAQDTDCCSLWVPVSLD